MRTDPSLPPAPLRLGHVTDRVIGTFFDVFNELGPGFLESIYQSAMTIALRESGLDVAREVPIDVFFRGSHVGAFRADLLVEGAVLVELKAVRTLEGAHLRQTINYLRASRLEVGLILNFGPKPQIKRVLLDNDRKAIRADPRTSVVGLSETEVRPPARCELPPRRECSQ